MSEVHAIWIASIAGAAIFFVAGYLSFRRQETVPSSGTSILTERSDMLSQIQTKELELESVRSNSQNHVLQLEQQLHAASDKQAISQKRFEGVESQLAELQHASQKRIASLQSSLESVNADVIQLRKKGVLATQQGMVAAKPSIPPIPAKLSSQALRELKTLNKNSGDMLQKVVTKIGQVTGSITVVLADRAGLPLVVQGQHGTEMAAYASMVSELAHKTSSFVPVSLPEHASFVDKSGASLSVWPFRADAESFSLAILSKADISSHTEFVHGAIATLKQYFEVD